VRQSHGIEATGGNARLSWDPAGPSPARTAGSGGTVASRAHHVPTAHIRAAHGRVKGSVIPGSVVRARAYG
jgi:hypothetical protein